MANGSYNEMTVYVDELNNEKTQDFIVFDTFPMNRSFILAFVSSLISFTALFLEVIYSYFRTGGSDAASCNCTTLKTG